MSAQWPKSGNLVVVELEPTTFAKITFCVCMLCLILFIRNIFQYSQEGWIPVESASSQVSPCILWGFGGPKFCKAAFYNRQIKIASGIKGLIFQRCYQPV